MYVNDAYYPREAAPEAVEAAEPPPAQDVLSDASGQQSWDSPDGKRNVQVFGPRAEAFLYDKASNPPVYLGYLSEGVSHVRFSGGVDGKPVEILVDFESGGFALYSADGKKLKS